MVSAAKVLCMPLPVTCVGSERCKCHFIFISPQGPVSHSLIRTLNAQEAPLHGLKDHAHWVERPIFDTESHSELVSSIIPRNNLLQSRSSISRSQMIQHPRLHLRQCRIITLNSRTALTKASRLAAGMVGKSSTTPTGRQRQALWWIIACGCELRRRSGCDLEGSCCRCVRIGVSVYSRLFVSASKDDALKAYFHLPSSPSLLSVLQGFA